jgi:hypothetical protein
MGLHPKPAAKQHENSTMLQHGKNKRPTTPSCDYGTLMTLMQLIYADEQKDPASARL